MKSTLIASLAAGAAAGNLRASPEFDAWAARFNKRYPTVEEATLRRSIFERKLAAIEAHNAGGHGWTKGVNQWSDLTADEWRQQVFKGRLKKVDRKEETPAPAVVPIFKGELPAAVNWTANGGVTPVKDQGQCGSCWAFATTVATEGAWAITKGTLVSLSEQQIVSCDKADGNDGCNGGDQLPALQWLAKQKGQCSEADYPYTSGSGKTGKCETTCTPVMTISKGVEVPKHNMTALMTAIANYPLSLSVDASNDSVWQDYNGGVVTGACSTCKDASCLDHGVGGAGYGTDPTNGDYWLVKNSWGSSWGEGGYIRLARGPKYDPQGQCGVQIDNQYAVI